MGKTYLEMFPSKVYEPETDSSNKGDYTKIVLFESMYPLNDYGPMYSEAKKADLHIAANNSVVADKLRETILGIQVLKIGKIPDESSSE